MPGGAFDSLGITQDLSPANMPLRLKDMPDVDGAAAQSGDLLMYEEGRWILSPTTGGMLTCQQDIASDVNTDTLLTGLGYPLLWGDLSTDTDALIATTGGWYRCSFNGVFASNASGTIRAMRLVYSGDGSYTGVPQGSFQIGATSDPVAIAGTSGYGLMCSATGLWYLNADEGVRVTARQDSGAVLRASANLTIERIQKT